MYLFMKESRAVIGGVRLREEPLTIWIRYIRNGIGNCETWSIYNDKYSDMWMFYT